MKTCVVFLLGILVGGTVAWWFAPGRYRHLYLTTQTLTLIGHEGREIGLLPKGTPLLADVKLDRTPDVGWWGFAPVLFDDMWEAQDLGVVAWDDSGEIWQRITLRAVTHSSDPSLSPEPTIRTPQPDQ